MVIESEITLPDDTKEKSSETEAVETSAPLDDTSFTAGESALREDITEAPPPPLDLSDNRHTKRFKRLLILILLSLPLGGGYAYFKGFIARYDARFPPASVLFDPRDAGAVSVLSADGTLIAKRGAEYAGSVRLDHMSPYLIKATLAAEDRKFFDHRGYDTEGILRAALANFKSGSVKQGGSTVTQQLAKDLFLSADKSYERKIKELIWALRLERVYRKKEILEIYLNRAYLGAGLYGVKAASETYFGKSPANLTLAEAALIAGLLKAPSRYSPRANPDGAIKRSRIVLKAMRKAGFITEAEYHNAIRLKLRLRQDRPYTGTGYLADKIRTLAPELIGKEAYDAVRAHSDAVVRTTVNTTLQTAADMTVAAFLKTAGARYGVSQAAFVAFDHKGAVLAMTGGADYGKTQFNRVTQALRQPGSAFKPFVYAAALEKGVSPDMIISDKPITVGKYSPQNYTGRYHGEVSVRSAFAHSLNTPAVRLAHFVGVKAVADTARRAGITAPLKKNMALALGASEVSLFELTAAYTPFFNKGLRVTPYFIEDISLPDGKIIYRKPPPETKRAFSPEIAEQMRDLLSAVTGYGTGKAAQLSEPIDIYGKTGTASHYRDAWFIGRAGDKNGITAGVWLGNDDFSRTDNMTGGGAAARLWKNIFDVYFKADPQKTAGLRNVNSKLVIKRKAFKAETGGSLYNADRIERLLKRRRDN